MSTGSYLVYHGRSLRLDFDDICARMNDDHVAYKLGASSNVERFVLERLCTYETDDVRGRCQWVVDAVKCDQWYTSSGTSTVAPVIQWMRDLEYI